MSSATAITEAIASANAAGRTALVPFVTAGFPDRESFADIFRTLTALGDVVEIGVPFTDPLADGVTIQRSSETALRNGVTLEWTLSELERLSAGHDTPVLLMSYLNPLLSLGFEALAERCVAARVAGFIVPDLPYEESGPLRAALEPRKLALVQLVSPVTAPERRSRLCEASAGFVYAVTVTGVTGGGKPMDQNEVFSYLDELRAVSRLPVCAGFGIRNAAQVKAIGAHAAGVIVGSALVELLADGGDARTFLQSLRGD